MANISIMLACFLLAFPSSHSDQQLSRNQGVAPDLWLAQAPGPSKQAPPPIPKPRSSDISPLARTYYKIAKEHYWAGNYDLAIEAFKKAVAVSPRWGDAHLYMGASLAIMLRLADAEVSLKKALEDPSLTDDDRAWAYWILGIGYARQGEYERAEANYRTAIKYSRDFLGTYNSLAYLYARQGRNLKEGLKLINYVLSKTPHQDSGEELDTRGWIYYKMGNYEKAERDLLDSLKLIEATTTRGLPEDNYILSEHHYHLGEIYLAQYKISLAKSHFQKSLDFNVENNEARLALERLRQNKQ
jgi:tetratricopeptide (TPR) repeat protein